MNDDGGLESSSAPAAAATAARASAMVGNSGEPAEPPMRWTVVARLGRRYLGAHRWRMLTYAVGMLLIVSVLPTAVVSRYGAITNFFQSRGRGDAGAPQERKSPGASAPTQAGREVRVQTTAGLPTDLPATYATWVVLVLVLAFLGFAHRYASAYFSSQVEQEMQADVFENVLHQSPRFFRDHPPGELTMVVNQLASQARLGLFQLLIDPVVEVASVVVIAATLYGALRRLGAEAGPRIYLFFAGIAVFALVMPLLVIRVGRALQRQQTAVQRQDLAMATLVNGAVASPEEIQAMEAEPIFAAKYRTMLAANMQTRLAQTVTVERLNLLNTLPGNVVLIAVIGVALLLLYLQASTPGAPPSASPDIIVKVGLLTPMLMGVVQSLASVSINARLNWPALEMIDQVLASHPDVQTMPGALELSSAEPTVEVRDVVFSYDARGGTANVLDGVTFRIPPGEVVGLVARPGRGKTTVFRLLLRFYDPQRGDLLLGGHPVRTLALSSLRRNVALMTQSSAFFHDSVRENFRVAAPDASDEEIRRTSERTSLWPILTSHFGRQPLESPFAAGQLLSGGQKKLFALTRLLLQHPSVVLFDEPTVGMGPLEKAPLVDVMRRACEGKTVIAVDHDIVWLIRFCDRFLVLDDGRIVQDGTSAELLARPGLFRDLYDAAQNQVAGAAYHATAVAAVPDFAAAPDFATVATKEH